jgi:glycosyltransferase involved in cell wall biosynthesis
MIMKIGIDIREAFKEKAGKGYYTIHLVSNLLKIDKKNKYLFFTDQPIEALSGHENTEIRLIEASGLKWHRKVLKESYKQNIDIFFSPTSYIIPAIHNPKKISVLMTVHDLISFLYPQKHNKKAVIIERLLLKKALKKSAHILSVSKNTKSDICNRFSCNSRKISVIPNAASDVFRPLENEDLIYFKEEKQLPDKFIFSAGTLEPRKNYDILIRAFSKIKSEFPKYKLLIAGKKGWNYENIFKTVEDLDMGDSVKFLDYIPERDLVRLYNLATVFAYVSLYEGFGIPPLEAMQSGCPVITSNVSSIPEVVNDAAILVNPEKEEDIAQAMKKLLGSPEMQSGLRKKGLKQAEKFSWKKSAQKLLNLLEKM